MTEFSFQGEDPAPKKKPKRRGVSRCPTEATEQIRFFAQVESFYPELRPYLTHIPNGEKRHPKTAAKLKAMGLTAGWPDIIFARGGCIFAGLYIEMKRQRGGSVSADQKVIHETLRSEGYRVEVCAGADAAIKVLLEYNSQCRPLPPQSPS